MPGEWSAVADADGDGRGWSTAAIVQVIYPDVGFLLQNAAGQGGAASIDVSDSAAGNCRSTNAHPSSS
jgi:hypothetical protein